MKELVFDLPHIRLNGLSIGDPSFPTVLCLHGWLDNAASFVPLSEFLTGYHLVALDFAGHGKSQHRSKDANYHLVDNVQDLNALFVDQHWHDLLVIGHSMGGIIAGMYASCFPEHVRKLCIIEAFGAIFKEAESSPTQLRESVISRREVAIKKPGRPKSYPGAIKARMAAGDMSESSAKLLMDRNIENMDGELTWRTDHRLRTFSSLRLTEVQSNSFLQGINCPTLAILGEQGFESLQEAYRERSHLISDLSLKSCPGGHHVQMDSPEAVSREILPFFAN